MVDAVQERLLVVVVVEVELRVRPAAEFLDGHADLVLGDRQRLYDALHKRQERVEVFGAHAPRRVEQKHDIRFSSTVF